jgi:SnoaL-like protein
LNRQAKLNKQSLLAEALEEKPMERSPELEDLTRKLYDAVSSADAGFFERYLSRGESCVVIGTAPNEWWEDYAAALDPIRKQMASVGDAVELLPGEVRAYRKGEVGWVADQPMLTIGSAAALCRHTSVFVREEGEWRIVQHHFSIGVSNDDVFGSEAGKLG